VQFRRAVVSVRMRTYVGSSNQRSASRNRGGDAPRPRVRAELGLRRIREKREIGKSKMASGKRGGEAPRTRYQNAEPGRPGISPIWGSLFCVCRATALL